MKTGIKLGLSLYIVYHLYGIILAPNSQTYLGFRSAPFFETYLSAFEFVSTWGFFAPDPGPPPIYIEWSSLDKNGNILETDTIPSVKDPFFFRERQNRRTSIARFMAGSDERAEKMLVPYLCKRDSNVFSVQIWRNIYPIPSPGDVSLGNRTLYDRKDFDRSWVGHSFCKEYQSRG